VTKNMMINQSLSAIASLDASPEEAVSGLRLSLKEPSREAAEAVYEALRAASWRLLTSRIYGSEIEAWFDLFSQAAALLRRDFGDLSERTTALADLATESARFGALHSHEQAIAKEHVIDVLRAIGKNGARKAEVMNATGLKQANLSRILANLIAVGLVDRKSVGKEASLTLSAAGLDALSPDVHPHGSRGLIVSPGVR
jgi:predicted transcriptional regulator